MEVVTHKQSHHLTCVWEYLDDTLHIMIPSPLQLLNWSNNLVFQSYFFAVIPVTKTQDHIVQSQCKQLPTVSS